MRALVALLAGVVIGCGSASAPARTPGTMDDVIGALVLRGVTVHRLVSGDAGCPGASLHDNAVHMEVALFDQSALHDIYLLRWRRQVDFDQAGPAFADCVAEYENAHPGAKTGRLELAPWRAYGTLWNAQLRSILEESLRASGGS